MMKYMVRLIFASLLFSGTCLAVLAGQNATDTTTPSQPAIIESSTANASPVLTPVLSNPIRIIHPAENSRLPFLASTYVCGSVPPAGRLLINGAPVPIHPDGGFLTMVSLTPGKFSIQAELQLGATTYRYTRIVSVAEPAKAAPVSPLTIEYVTPTQDQELQPGDYVEVVCKGSPGSTGYFTVTGIRKKYPLVESTAAPSGIYRGVYRVGVTDRLNRSRIKVTLVNQKKQKRSMQAAGTLSLFPDGHPVLVEVSSANAVLRSGPALSNNDRAGYQLFPPTGTLLQITGRKGNEYRVRLTKAKSVWINSDQVKPLPRGMPLPQIAVGTVKVSANAGGTIVRIPIRQKIPFQVSPDAMGEYIDISLFGAYSNTDWINNPAAGVINSLSWFQDDSETYRLRAYTTPNSWWGYDARYEDNELILELRTPLPLSAASSPLAGLTIAIDAGHGTGTGAIGATGYAEGDANLAQALALKAKLLAKGVRVIMVRPDGEDVSLNKRPKIAWQNKADLLVSIHNNSLGYGGNPFVKRGFGIYYSTPMSLPLAKEIHAAYGEAFPAGGEFNLPDDGLYFANLALTRAPQMPSVLIESAYLIVPEEEAYLKTDRFRAICADAITSGLECYARRMRPKPSP